MRYDAGPDAGQGLREQKDELLAVYREAYAKRLHDEGLKVVAIPNRGSV